MKKRYGIAAALLGIAALGSAGTAYAAFGPGHLNPAALSGFSAEEQAAIEKADDIRAQADEEANAVLEAAGVSQEELHDAMDAYHQKRREEMDAALEANDYAAFSALVAGSPMEGKLTQDAFAKLVEMHKLEKAGDKDGAAEIRKELADEGFMPMHGPRGGHMGPPPEDN